MPSPTSPDRDLQSRLERQIARDLLDVTRRETAMLYGLDALVLYLREHPDATPDEVAAAMAPVLDRAVRDYLSGLYAVLVEDLPAAVSRLE